MNERKEFPDVEFTFVNKDNKSEKELEKDFEEKIRKRNQMLINQFGYTVDENGYLVRPDGSKTEFHMKR